MIVPPALAGGALNSPQSTWEPSAPTREASSPAPATSSVSSGFFLAPMIAFSDG